MSHAYRKERERREGGKTDRELGERLRDEYWGGGREDRELGERLRDV